MASEIHTPQGNLTQIAYIQQQGSINNLWFNESIEILKFIDSIDKCTAIEKTLNDRVTVILANHEKRNYLLVSLIHIVNTIYFAFNGSMQKQILALPDRAKALLLEIASLSLNRMLAKLNLSKWTDLGKESAKCQQAITKKIARQKEGVQMQQNIPARREALVKAQKDASDAFSETTKELAEKNAAIRTLSDKIKNLESSPRLKATQGFNKLIQGVNKRYNKDISPMALEAERTADIQPKKAALKELKKDAAAITTRFKFIRSKKEEADEKLKAFEQATIRLQSLKTKTQNELNTLKLRRSDLFRLQNYCLDIQPRQQA